ncbi:MAG: CHASE2 domain-containing protein [Syntrophobacteraceae bacterium]
MANSPGFALPLRAIVGTLTLVVSFAFCLSPWGKGLERIATDTLFFLRGPMEPPSEIIVVGIDEPSFGVLQQQWPWPRSVHARLIETLHAAGAKMVAFDVIFAEKSTSGEDSQLARALSENGPVLLAADFNVVDDPSFTQEILVTPDSAFQTPGAHMGFVNLPVDEDGLVRRIRTHRGGLTSLPVLACELYCQTSPCGNRPASPPNAQTDLEHEINFIGGPRSIRTISYYQAMDPATYLPEGFLADKIVFVGLVTGTAIEGRSRGPENFPVPVSRWGGGYMAGVEIHAQAAASILSRSLLSRAPLPWVLGVSLPLAIGLALLFFKLKPLPAISILGLSGALGIALPYWLFTRHFLILPPTFLLVPSFACYMASPFVHYWEVWKERNFIRKAFSTYLAPSVVNQLLDRPEQLRLGGQVVEATVLFLDVAGFTTLSEKTRPELLIQVLNRYLGTFSDIVFRWGGMVDKFIGDAVMATWGVPLAQEDHAVRACHAALEMKEAMKHLGDEENERGTGLHLRIRIGINSGSMVAGNVGGDRHFNYTVLGDEVNLASRLESINRVYGTVVLISQNAARLLNGAFDVRELDFVRVKGKSEPVRIYELQGGRGTSGDAADRVNALFAAGRTHYEACQWSEARACFEACLAIAPNDGPSRCFSDRCRDFEHHPPGSGWDCAVSLEK